MEVISALRKFPVLSVVTFTIGAKPFGPLRLKRA